MQRTLFTGIDSNFHSKFHSNEIVKMIVSYYIIYANHFDRPEIKATVCKINNFSFFTSMYPKYYCRQLSCAKSSCAEI